jgi:hypothetical protein
MNLRALTAFLLAGAFGGVVLFSGVTTAQETFQLTPAVRSLFGMEYGYFWFSGETLIPAGGRPKSGTMVSVSGELGVDQGEATTIVLQSEILGSHLLELDVLASWPTGLKRVENSFRFQNKTYFSGTMLETKLDLNWMRLAYGYKLLDTDNWWLAPRIGLHYIHYGITVNGESWEAGLISNTRRLDAIYPVLGVETRYVLPYGFDISLEMEGIYLFTGGFLTLARVGTRWRMHPDVVLALDCSSRMVRRVGDNQLLNNEWFVSMFGLSGGFLFAF